MLKNNGKMVIGKHILLCIAVICLIFTASGFGVENSFAVELNETVDDMGLESDNVEKLENSQENEVLGVNSQDQLGATRSPNGNIYSSIQDAVNAASAGDTIYLSGTYHATGNDRIMVHKPLTIVGDSTATLDGKGISTAIGVTPDGEGTVIKNIKFINHRGDVGSVLIIYAKNVRIENCVFEDNHADEGGAIQGMTDYLGASGLVIDNCQFRRNAAYYDNLEKTSWGPAICMYSLNSEVKNSIFEDNYAKSKTDCWGGAIQVGLDEISSNIKVTNCIFKNNKAISLNGHSHGGAGCVRTGTIYSGCTFINNNAIEGGALTFHASGVINDCTFIGNEASEYGGALSTGFLYDYMDLSILNCNFERNSAPMGGAIQAKGLNILVQDSNFKKNSVTENGGAIYAAAEDVTIKKSTFNSNRANIDGGAVYIKGKNTIVDNSTFISNEAIPDVKKLDDGLGGAIYVNSSLANIKNNIFRFNTARNGSAIYYDVDGQRLTLQNNELFQNQAWVYALPISTRDIYYGDDERITVTLFGGNNIADYDNLAVSNAIYNAADNQNIVIDGEYPLDGATNTGELYQDSREYNINVLLTVQHEDGTLIYNDVGHTSYLGEIIVDFENLKPGKYFVKAKHYEDDYYKEITNTTTFTVYPKVDNEVTKTVSKTIGNFEDIITWTITVKNHGPNDSTNVTVYDVLPSGLNWMSDTSKGKYNPDTGVLTIGNLRVNEEFAFDITTIVNKTGEIVNSVRVTSNEFDTDYSNNVADKSIFINPASDLVVFKGVSNSKPNYNDTITWTIRISNNGPDIAYNVVMRDVLPKSLVYIDSDGDYNENTGIWNIESLGIGETVELNIICSVNQTGFFENFVSVNATEHDYDPTNNNDSEMIYVSQASDLSIQKTVNASIVNFNDIIKWTVVVTNNGPDDAVNVRVVDFLPEGFTYVDSTMTKGNYNDGVFTVGNLGVKEKVTIEIITLVEATGDFVNVANVKSDNYDPDLTNNEAEKDIFVNPASDLLVIKSVSDSNPQFRDIITWTIEIINNGPDIAHNITLKDLLPSSLIWIGDDSEGGYNPKTGILFIDELDVEEGHVLNIDCMVNSTGLIRNDVSVNTSEYDYDVTNNYDNVTIDVDKSADVSVVKLVDNSAPNYNDLVKWTLIISNNGPDKATEVHVEDQLPEGLILVSYTATKGIYDNGTWMMCCLENNETQRLEIVCRVNKTGRLTNLAEIHADEYDFDESNNKDNESIDVPLAVDLEVIIEADNTNPIFGESVTWMISVRNKGPDDATGVILEDILPKELIFTGSESLKGVFSDNLWDIGPLNVGDAVHLNITTISNALGIIPNEVKATSREYDWNMANNHDDDKIDVRPIADLSIIKLVNKQSPKYGEKVKWTLIASNDGPNVAHDVVVQDILPKELTLISSSGDYSGGIWKVGTLEVGEQKSLEIICKVTSTGHIVNNAKIWAYELDLDQSNNQASGSINVAPASDLSVTKLASKYHYRVGDVIEYVIEVVNNGPDTAHNIKISEILDDLLKVKSFKVTKGKFNKFINIWTITSLGYGESAKLIIRVIATGSGIIKNTVTVTSDTFDYDKSNNKDYAVVNVIKKPLDRLPNTSKGNLNTKLPSNLEMHPTANPLILLMFSLLFSIIFSGGTILKKR